MREVGSPIDLVRQMTWEEVIQPTLEDAVPVALTDIELKQSAIASTISDVNPATFVSTFITNQVMFPNGTQSLPGSTRSMGGDEANMSPQGWMLYTGSGCLCTAGASDSKWEGQPGKWELKEGDVVVRPTPLCLSHGVAHSVCLRRRACCSTSTRPP